MRSDVLNKNSSSYGQQVDRWRFSAKTAAFTAASGFCYLVTDADGCAVTLPEPSVGDRIKIVVVMENSTKNGTLKMLLLMLRWLLRIQEN